MIVTKDITKEVRFSVINKVTEEIMVTNALINMNPLYYCQEQIFSFEAFAQTEWQQQQIKEGIHHFYSLNYAPTGHYNAVIKDESNNDLPVVNLSMNNFWKAVFKEVLKDESKTI